MKISIAFSWPAGSGINTCGIVLGQILSEYGYFIYGDKEYSSLIKGGNNLFVLYISDTHHFISRTIDSYIFFDDFAQGKNEKIYTINTSYFVDKREHKNQNAFAIGLATKILGLDFTQVRAIFLEKLPERIREETAVALQQWFDSIEQSVYSLMPLRKAKGRFCFWNEIVSEWAIESGLEFYSAYPMTPASSLVDIISEDSWVVFFQWEDEIAVSMSMLGAKFGGKRAMCGTSGGGFALMSESISFSNQAELGGVYILSQRAGPSTGTPTFTGQWDLNYALNATFGDTFPVVLAPYTFTNWYNLIGKALNWSDVYQYPIIFLIDKSFSESYMSVDETRLITEPIKKWKLVKNPPETFARYNLSSDGISEYSIPGTANGEFIASSYEHDIYGKETEESEIKMQMEEKRFQKLTTFIRDEFNDGFYCFDVINPDATKFFITYGVNFYAIHGFIADHPDAGWGAIVLKVIQPMDMRLKEFLNDRSKHIERLTFVEQNYSGQLENVVCNKLWLQGDGWQWKIDHLRSYDLYPIFEEQIWEKV